MTNVVPLVLSLAAGARVTICGPDDGPKVA
jgi:hypothetical protein